MFQLPRLRKGSVQPKPAKANARKFCEFLKMNFVLNSIRTNILLFLFTLQSKKLQQSFFLNCTDMSLRNKCKDVSGIPLP